MIDAGNANFRDTVARFDRLKDTDLTFIGMGVSGGEEGARHGPSIMVGGTEESWKRVEKVLTSIAARYNDEPCVAWLGNDGAGHFVKMVHNGIEYGLMAAYAEGLNILKHANIGAASHEADAETAPLAHPEHFQYDFNLQDVAEVWRRGSVITSWLLDLTADALHADPALSKFAGRVSDSGEGRWTIMAAIDESVPTPVLSAALYGRFSSRDNDEFANKVLSAMRAGFGGHVEKPTPK